MSIKIQNQVSNLFEINSNSDAIINVLANYCENHIESPTSECLFDINVGLQQIKEYSKQTRKILEQLCE